MLRQLEQTDLMSYGLIPEFVGRFPIITALHVSGFYPVLHTMQLAALLLSCIVQLFLGPLVCSQEPMSLLGPLHRQISCQLLIRIVITCGGYVGTAPALAITSWHASALFCWHTSCSCGIMVELGFTCYSCESYSLCCSALIYWPQN